MLEQDLYGNRIRRSCDKELNGCRPGGDIRGMLRGILQDLHGVRERMQRMQACL